MSAAMSTVRTAVISAPWDRRRLKLFGAATTAACLTATALAPAAQANSPSDPVALVVDTAGASLAQAEFDVLLWPREDIEKRLKVGNHVPTHALPKSAVVTDGSSFSVHMGPEDVPKGFIEDDGRVHIDVMIRGAKGQELGNSSKTVNLVKNSGKPQWVDAEKVGAKDDTKLGPARMTTKLAERTQPSTAGSPAAGTAAGVSCGWNLEANSDRLVEIAKTYVPDGTSSTAFAHSSSGRSQTMGVALNGGNGWYNSSSTKTISVGSEFTWNKNTSSFKKYRVDTRYGKYRYFHCSGGYFGTTKWAPRYNTGGYTSYTSSYQPTWGSGYCKDVDPGDWKRARSDGRHFSSSNGVEISSLIGFDLATSHNYYSDHYVQYHVVGTTKKMCGNNHIPAFASLVRMYQYW